MAIELIMRSLRQLENEPSTINKRIMIKEYVNTVDGFGSMLQYALNPYVRFNTQTIHFRVDRAGDLLDIEWQHLQIELDKITKNNLRGDALIEHQANVARTLNPLGRELFKRVLLKDLRCGVGATLVNSVFPGLIPEFGVMLASPIEEKDIKRLRAKEKIYYQPKLNGDRMVAVIHPAAERKANPSKALSRKGFELLNYGAILRSLEFVVDQNFPKTGCVFDGEVTNGTFFETRQTKKLAGNEVALAIFNVFDAVILGDWKQNKSSTYSARLRVLHLLENNDAWKHFFNLEMVTTIAILPGEEITMEFLDKRRDRFVSKGYEGLIIRLDEEYNYSTRSSLYKHKKMETADCVIIEVLAGKEGKKHGETAGRILVEQDNGAQCKAGLKMSDKQRDELWAKRNEVAGKIAEIQYQEMTQPKSGLPKMQFPVFLRIREDKS